MATDMQRLVVALEARTAAFEKAMNRANGVANRRARAIESRFAAMNRHVGSTLAGVGRTWVAGIAAAIGTRELAQLSDAATRIENALKVTGLSGAELEKVYGRLRDSALENYAPLETLATLYSRLGLAQQQLGVTNEEMLNFTDKVALALRVQGTTAQEARGALIQLSQAMGSGVVRAEEFNSIVEGAPSILRAAAMGMEEAGGSVARLRQLVIDGQVSSQAFFRAFEAGAPMLEGMVKNAEVTIAQAFGNLYTALVDTAREFENATGASGRFAGSINSIAEAIASVDFAGFITKIQETHGALDQFLDNLANAGLIERFAEAVTGLQLEVGKPIDLNTVAAEQKVATMEREIALLQEQIANSTELGFDTTEAHARLNTLRAELAAFKAEAAGVASRGYAVGTPGDPNALAQQAGGVSAPTAIAPISIADFPVTGGGGGGSGRGSGGGGGRGSGGRSGAQRARDELREAEKAAREFERAERDAARAAEEMGGALGDAVGGFVDALKDGKIEAGELLGIVANLVQKMISMNGGGGFGGGFFSALLGSFGGFFADGGRLGAGKWGIAGERGPEIIKGPANVVPMTAPRIPREAASGVVAPITVTINAPGADAAALARVERSVQELGRNIPKMVDARTKTAQTRGTRA